MNPEYQELAPETAPLPAETFWGYADLALFLGAALPSLVLSALILRGALALARAAFSSDSAKTLTVQALSYLFMTGALYLIVAGKYRRPFLASMGWSASILRASPLLAAGPALAIGIGGLGVALGLPAEPSKIEFLITGRMWLLIWAFVGVLLAPAFEETLFRGFLFPLLTKTFGPYLAIFLTAIPFGLLHGAQNHWAWQPIVLIALAGAAFGWVRYRTGSTAAAFLLHAAYNGTEFVLFAIQRWSMLK